MKFEEWVGFDDNMGTREGRQSWNFNVIQISAFCDE